MKDLSLNILDITHNSITAGAENIEVLISESGNKIRICITDNGCGIDRDMLAKVTDPFTTTRTTRRIGMGIPLFKLAAEQTGGYLKIKSKLSEGTEVEALFYKDHIDCPPLGDVASTIALLIAAIPKDSDLTYIHTTTNGEFSIGSAEIRSILGSKISLGEPEIQEWITDYIRQQYKIISCI